MLNIFSIYQEDRGVYTLKMGNILIGQSWTQNMEELTQITQDKI